jgi:nitroimidazol reductase NimA-like FMN-containing flavoprotein (pyridoxamine 5'-phosphate oxidase superfamily)
MTPTFHSPAASIALPRSATPRSMPQASPLDPAGLRWLLTSAIVARVGWCADTGPRITPMWFLWDGAALWFETAPDAPLVVAIDRDPRVAVEIGESEGGLRVRSLSAVGVASVERAQSTVAAVVAAMFQKYLGSAALEAASVQRLVAAPHVAVSMPISRVVGRDDTLTGLAPLGPA